MLFAPVVASDGRVWDNACLAEANGMKVRRRLSAAESRRRAACLQEEHRRDRAFREHGWSLPITPAEWRCEHRGIGLGQTAPTAEEIAQGRRDAQIANEAGIQVPMLRAIRGVESGASPSAIRFEPHLFRRDSSRGMEVPYTPGTTGCRISRAASCIGSETNRAAFSRAFALDPVNAVKSTSWGSYQVLGRHLLRLFGENPARSVQEFDRSPAVISERVLVSWMNANPLARLAARTLNFGGFAHRYNGCTDCTTYEARLRQEYNEALPLWRRVAPLVGTATPGDIPGWVPWVVAAGAGTLVLGGVAAVALRSR